MVERENCFRECRNPYIEPSSRWVAFCLDQLGERERLYMYVYFVLWMFCPWRPKADTDDRIQADSKKSNIIQKWESGSLHMVYIWWGHYLHYIFLLHSWKPSSSSPPNQIATYLNCQWERVRHTLTSLSQGKQPYTLTVTPPCKLKSPSNLTWLSLDSRRDSPGRHRKNVQTLLRKAPTGNWTQEPSVVRQQCLQSS